MIGGVNSASSQLASMYNAGSEQLAATLTKIATGKKFQNASEDLLGFIRSNNVSVEINGYNQVKEGLTEFKTFTSAAVQSGGSIYENLTKLKSLSDQYADTTDVDKQAEYAAEFNSLRTQVTSALDNSSVDGVDVMATGSVKTANLDQSGNTLDMNFSAVANSAEIAVLEIDDDVTAVAGLDEQIEDSLTYLSEAKAYDNIASQQIKLTDTIVNSKEALKSLITDIDDAEETGKAIDQSIRQQAAVSMMAQANMARQSVLKLYS
jgi:flagellin